MLGLLLATQLIASAPAPAIAPGTYTYKATLGGQSVGTSTITVKSNGASTEIDERLSGSFQGTASSGNVVLVLGSDLSPASYQATGNMGGVPVKDSATVANGTANITNARGQNSFELAGGAQHFVVVDLGTFAGFMPLAAQMKAWNGAIVLAVIPSFGQSLPIAPDPSASATRPASVPAGDAELSFSGQAPFTIWYDPSTYIPDEIDTAQGVTVTRQP